LHKTMLSSAYLCLKVALDEVASSLTIARLAAGTSLTGEFQKLASW